jgi:hypothetical protein
MKCKLLAHKLLTNVFNNFIKLQTNIYVITFVFILRE